MFVENDVTQGRVAVDDEGHSGDLTTIYGDRVGAVGVSLTIICQSAQSDGRSADRQLPHFLGVLLRQRDAGGTDAVGVAVGVERRPDSAHEDPKGSGRSLPWVGGFVEACRKRHQHQHGQTGDWCRAPERSFVREFHGDQEMEMTPNLSACRKSRIEGSHAQICSR